MLEILTGSQIILQPISQTDSKLKGQIILKNNNSNLFMPFKVKSTDKNAFQVDPSKGIVGPYQTITIKIFTVLSVDIEYAKILSQKNKFMIQYGIFKNKPESIQDAMLQLNNNQTQNIKICINTDSVRGSRKTKPFNQVSIKQSNKYSFHSTTQKKNTPFFSLPPLSLPQNQTGVDQMDRLKSQIDYLQKQRTKLSKDLKLKNKGTGKQGNFIKYIVILVIGVIIGNIASKYTMMQQFLTHQISNHHFFQLFRQQPQPKPQQGFFSIFNFGDQEPVKQKKSWWNIF